VREKERECVWKRGCVNEGDLRTRPPTPARAPAQSAALAAVQSRFTRSVQTV